MFIDALLLLLTGEGARDRPCVHHRRADAEVARP
jgi:hypothetical protein